ncbi:hypothetical protein B7494_g8267 [Chlorociboria aeruginascens]|nr:hypothetical protein B7494_g8267 [Chlorociboria aeruginascens]
MTSISASRIPALGLPSQTPTPTQSDTTSTSTHPYTCNSCQVAFRNSDLQRSHMRSDWHRYNLKRRVTSLPPISSEIFTEKVLQAQASSTAAASKASFEKTCVDCQRTYFSENAYHNHLGSQKHKAKVAMAGEHVDDETSSVISSTFSLGEPIANNDTIDPDAEEEFNEVIEGIKKTNLKDLPPVTRRPARPHYSDGPKAGKEGSVTTASSVTTVQEEKPAEPLKRCLFCNYDSPTIPLNAAHMERIHGMFIPERSYLVDLDGLIGSLREKVYEYHECLYCGKLKPTVFGIQTHMRDKGHCKIPFFTEDEQLEIGDFYDFTSTYSDVEEESDPDDELPGKKQSGGVRLGAKREAKINGDGDEEMEIGDGWETDSSASSLDSADLTAVPMDERTHQYEKLDQHPHHSHSDPRPHHNKDGWHSHAHKHNHAVFYSDYELHLPSGRVAGHRSLNKYFRQNLHSHPSPAERQERLTIEAEASSESEEMDVQVARRNERERGRALVSRANGGMGMLGVTAEKRKEVHAAEKRSRKVEERERRKFQWGNNKQSNSQKHFRANATSIASSSAPGKMTDQMGTPNSTADLSVNGGKVTTVKDKACPFCDQHFTSSSLGRHLDLYIKEKNPKPADGIHIVEEIRKMRGGITRRQPRNSTSKREDSTPAGTPRALNAVDRRSPHPDLDMGGNRSPSTRRDDGSSNLMNYNGTKNGIVMNGASWESTGVINNIPAARNGDSSRSWDGEDSRDGGKRTDARSRSVSRQTVAKNTFEQKQKLTDALDTAKAAELALRELLGSIRAAIQRTDGPKVFDYNPLALDFPSLTLHCLPPPPTIQQSTPVASSKSWSIGPPDEQQYQALRTHFSSKFHRWRVSFAIATTAPQDDLSYPPIQQGFSRIGDPDDIAQRTLAEAAELENQISEHLHTMFGHWTSLSLKQRTESWILHLARSIETKHEEIITLKKEREASQQEIEHLKLQVDSLSRLQQPREFKFVPPSTIPIEGKIVSQLGEFGIRAPGVGFSLTDRSLHLDTVIERVIGRWKGVVKEARGGSMAAQRTLSGTLNGGASVLQIPQSVQTTQKLPTNPSTPATLSTINGNTDAIGSDQDADGDADMEDDEQFAEMTDPNKRVPEAQIASSANFRLSNGDGKQQGANPHGLQSPPQKETKRLRRSEELRRATDEDIASYRDVT